MMGVQSGRSLWLQSVQCFARFGVSDWQLQSSPFLITLQMAQRVAVRCIVRKTQMA